MSDYIIGSDEVGWGALAGPLFVCAVAVPKGWKGPPGLDDSKELTARQRERIYPALEGLPLSLMQVPHDVFDAVGPKEALVSAHTAAIEAMLQRFPEAAVVVDGDVSPRVERARCVRDADALFPAVSAASIVAKVNRDYVMKQFAVLYPGYGFETNAGYGGNKVHQRGLEKLGVCPIHRRSYAPIKKLLGGT
jgi:ribonuclease HII